MTKRDDALERNRWRNHYAALSGLPPRNIEVVPEKRKYTKGASKEPKESDILKAVMQAVRLHPKVAIVWRQNSGTFKVGGEESKRYVRANSQRGMSDVMGTLKDGRTLAIEVKSRMGVLQQHQKDFLDKINAAGGLAFVARSVDDVLKALK